MQTLESASDLLLLLERRRSEGHVNIKPFFHYLIHLVLGLHLVHVEEVKFCVALPQVVAILVTSDLSVQYKRFKLISRVARQRRPPI